MDKELKLQMWRDFLIEQDVHFNEHANGHFLVYNAFGVKLLQFWGTTNKYNFFGSGAYPVGEDKLKREIKKIAAL